MVAARVMAKASEKNGHRKEKNHVNFLLQAMIHITDRKES